MIKHLVFFKFKPETSEADKQGFKAQLDGLPAKIDVIKSYQAGFDVIHSARAFDVALIMDFETLAALDVYAKHEHHLPVIERSKGFCEQVASVDFEY